MGGRPCGRWAWHTPRNPEGPNGSDQPPWKKSIRSFSTHPVAGLPRTDRGLTGYTCIATIEGEETMLAIRLPENIEARLGQLAQETGLTKTALVREAILEHIDDLEDLSLIHI